MAFTVTSRGRQFAMATMLALAVAGAVIRWQAPNPSIWRDVGSLLLVMWLPAVGNLIAFVVRKLPRAAPPPTEFTAGSPFTPQALVHLQPVPLPAGFIESLHGRDPLGVVLTGRHGFTVRLDRPIAEWLANAGDGAVRVQFLRPKVALRSLAPDMPIHLLVGKTAVAKGTFVERLLLAA